MILPLLLLVVALAVAGLLTLVRSLSTGTDGRPRVVGADLRRRRRAVRPRPHGPELIGGGPASRISGAGRSAHYPQSSSPPPARSAAVRSTAIASCFWYASGKPLRCTVCATSVSRRVCQSGTFTSRSKNWPAA